MSMHSDRHNDYLASSLDGSYWPAVLVIAAMIAIATFAWMSG